MLSVLEPVAIGAALIAVAALGLARAAVYFRTTTSTGDRFFSTSMVSVALVAMAVAGAFYVGRAAVDADGALGLLIAATGIVYTGMLPFAMWRWFGPQPEAMAERMVA